MSYTNTPGYSRSQMRKWIASLIITFVLLGSGWGSWLSRFPTIRDELGLSLSQMSVLVLMPSIGAIVGLLTASKFVTRLGQRRMIVTGLLMMAFSASLGTLTLFMHHDVIAYVLLFLLGFGFGLTDVSLNVNGSYAERASGRPRMSLLHAGFSIGGIVAFLLGGYAEYVQLDVVIHQVAVNIVIVLTILVVSVWIIDDASGARRPVSTATSPIPVKSRYRPWRDPIVWVLGFIGLSGSLADGVATDWIPLAMVDEYDLNSNYAVLMLTLVFAGGLGARLVGDYFVARFGQVRMLKIALSLAFIGVMLVAVSPVVWLAIPGAVLWGAGGQVAYPICISAAANDPETAADRVGAVSTISYTAYAAGPVVFGVMGDHFGLRLAFLILAVILAAGWVVSRYARSELGTDSAPITLP